MKLAFKLFNRSFQIGFIRYDMDNLKMAWDYDKFMFCRIRFYHEPYEPEGHGGWDDRQEYLEQYTLSIFNIIYFVYFPPEPTKEEKWRLRCNRP